MAIIHGIDENDSVIPLLLDANGRPLVVSSPLIGTSPHLRRIDYNNTTLAAGTSTLTVGTITVGEVWQIDQIHVQYTGTVAGVNALVRQNISGTVYIHVHITAFVTAIWQVFNLSVLADGGTTIEVVVNGATLNDDIRVRVLGRRVG